MINRTLSKFLARWKDTPTRLPLILRGARQVGKTTLINNFANHYDQYLYFNLEIGKDAALFKNKATFDELIQLLFLARNYTIDINLKTLIFIDEAQQVPEVISTLRYFHENYPQLHVIVSGSLIDFALQKLTKVPVGRVEFAELHPLSFREYLSANGNDQLLKKMDEEIPFNNNFITIAQETFHQYAMIGGMPKIVKTYLESQDMVRVGELFNGIIEAYKSDVSKYSKNQAEVTVIQQAMDAVPYLVDERINMAKFGNLAFKSSDIKNALQLLEQARLIQLNYPTTNTKPPILSDFRKRPRLHFLDIGVLNHQLGLHKEYLTIHDLDLIYKGSLVQQIVAQEIKAQSYLTNKSQPFWVREEKGTTSEVDMLYAYKTKLIPIEIKAGATGTLRSLHEFMDRVDHSYAIRLYGGELRIDEVTTRGNKKFQLLNLPYFLSGWIEYYLDWFVKEIL